MNNKLIILTVFVLMALAQLYIPANMIWEREAVIAEGNEYRFRTAPVDPYDPFRGKYITLNFEDNSFYVDTSRHWMRNESVYVGLKNDKEGFAQIESVTREIPDNGNDYIKCRVSSVNSYDQKLWIDFPFERYYMEESKAAGAEETYNRFSRDSIVETYAVVRVKDGEGVLMDVMIDGISIKDYQPEELLEEDIQ